MLRALEERISIEEPGGEKAEKTDGKKAEKAESSRNGLSRTDGPSRTS